MPTTVTGDSSNFPNSVQVPSDGDGPGIKAADFVPGYEGLMDRTEYLYKRGGRIIASLGSLPAAASADGDVVFIPYLGYYYFSAGIALGTEDGLFAVRNAADTGTWFWEGYSLLSGEAGSPYLATNGLAKVTGGKIGIRVIPNAIVGVATDVNSTPFATTSSIFVDAHVVTPIAVQTADRLLIQVHGDLYPDLPYTANARIAVLDPDGNEYVIDGTASRTQLATSDLNYRPYVMNCWHIAQATGDAQVKVQIARTGAGGAQAHWSGHPQIIVTQIRP